MNDSFSPEQKSLYTAGRASNAVSTCSVQSKYVDWLVYIVCLTRLCAPISEHEVSSDDCQAIDSFLYDRNVIQIACIQLKDRLIQFAEKDGALLDVTHSTANEINNMVDLYNNLTEYRHLPTVSCVLFT